MALHRYWYGPHEFGQLGVRSSLKDALGVAVAIHAMIRNGIQSIRSFMNLCSHVTSLSNSLFSPGDVYTMATYSQAVNVFGAIKTSRLGAELDPVGLALALYSARFAHSDGDGDHAKIVASVRAPSTTAEAVAAETAAADFGIKTGADFDAWAAGSLGSDEMPTLELLPEPKDGGEGEGTSIGGLSREGADGTAPVAMGVRASSARRRNGPALRVVQLDLEGNHCGGRPPQTCTVLHLT